MVKLTLDSWTSTSPVFQVRLSNITESWEKVVYVAEAALMVKKTWLGEEGSCKVSVTPVSILLDAPVGALTSVSEASAMIRLLSIVKLRLLTVTDWYGVTGGVVVATWEEVKTTGIDVVPTV